MIRLGGAVGLSVAGALVLPLAWACAGEPQPSFGPPGGLEGAMLPPSDYVPPADSGKSDGSMKKCMFTAPSEAGTAETGFTESGLVGDGSGFGDAAVSEGGTPVDAGAGEGGTPADAGSPDSGGCAVSWTRDIFPNMTAAGQWQCASSSCHGGGGVLGPTLNASDPKASYDALAAYKSPFTTPALPYILPCSTDPSKSAIVCNTSTMKCGPPMPLTTNGAKPLTPNQVDMIKTWIGCGAIDN